MGEIVKWVLIGWSVFGSLVVVTQVGKPRKPLTGGTAAFVVAYNALMIAAVLTWWGQP